MLEKSTKSTPDPADLFGRQTWGIFLSRQRGRMRIKNVPNKYPKRAQNVPGGHHRDPGKYFEIKIKK